ncbi:hypothetical protein [Psychrilyobacter sp.]|uniref:hypothetical protein n=1 Tax=Psychrilyobacter sp. TaxID=2586924 RepID=UPI003016BA6F
MKRVTISGQLLSETLGISERYLRELANDGIVEKIEKNKYDLLESVKRYVKSTEKILGNNRDEENEINNKNLADILGVADRTLRELAQRQVVMKKEKGVYLFKESVESYIRYLKSKNDKNQVTISEELRKKQADRELSEIKLEEKKGNLHEVAVVKKFVENMLVAFKQKARAIPTKLAPLLAVEKDKNKIEALIKKIIDDALREMSGYEVKE